MLDAHWWLVAVLRRTVRTSAKPTASYALVERIDLIRPGPFMSLAATTDGKWFDIESIYGQCAGRNRRHARIIGARVVHFANDDL